MRQHNSVLILDATDRPNVRRNASVYESIICAGIRGYGNGPDNKEAAPCVEFTSQIGEDGTQFWKRECRLGNVTERFIQA